MNNLLSYCGLTDARMNPSEKDLPVKHFLFFNVHPGTFIFVAIIRYVSGTSNIGSSTFGPKRGPFIQMVKSFGHMVKILEVNFCLFF